MSSDCISLEDFVLEMMRVPSCDLTLAQLEDVFGKLTLPGRLVDPHVNFSSESYTRNLLCRTPRFDMLILCWKPGQVTTIHDHTGSLGSVRAFHGQVSNRTFEVVDSPEDGRTPVRMVEECAIEGDRLCSVERGGIHQMVNVSDADAVTVHVYACPLQEITVFDLETGATETLTLRYSLEEEFG